MPQPRGNSVEIHCFVKKSTDAHLMVLLTKGLQSWRKNEELNTDNFPEWYHQLISEQNAIGWRQLFNGRWSTQWSVIQHQHYQQKKTKNQTGHKWSKQMLLVIWDLWDELWKCRNSTEHGDSITDQHAITRGRLLQELKDLYADSTNYVPSDRKFLLQNYQEHAKKSYLSISSWLAFYIPILKNSQIRAAQNSTTNMKSLSAYFSTKLPTMGPRRQQKNHCTPTLATQRRPLFPC
mmetsp:Transcript_5146/g.7930  ORF Transcript_5146/g.7930 Transcript_5146/m.7930 type:complete len:235 (-) Transcript_5146:487-1191(-)